MGEAERTAAAQALTRFPRARVTIDWADPYRDASIVASTNDGNYINWPNQVADNIEGMPYKYFHLDSQTPLSENMHPGPSDSATAVDYQLGWWGTKESGVGGAFSTPYPTLTVEFSPRPIYEMRIVGDDQYGEYPVDFTWTVYNANNTTLYTEVVTGNASVVYLSDVTSQNIQEATRAELVISKWSGASRVVKISEFFASVINTYEGDEIVRLGILEESEIANGSLPIGNISANECDLQLQNIDDQYFPDNDDSPLAPLIGRNRKISIELGWVVAGGSTEYTPFGTFWSGEWATGENMDTAKTSARDRMELLRTSTYVPTDVYEGETIYALLTRVLDNARLFIQDLTYAIDTELDGADYVVPFAVFERKSHFETIRRLCEASMAFAYCSRDDVVTIMGPTAAGDNTGTPYDITKDYYFDAQQLAKTEEMANIIEVTTNPLETDATASRVYISNEPLSLLAGESETYQIKYSFQNTEKAILEAIATLIEPDSDPETTAADCSITSAVYYSWGADITVAATADTSFNIAVSGKKLSVQGSETIVARDDTSVGIYGELTYDKIKDNLLIQSRTMAQNIADSLLATYRYQRKDVTVQWCGDTAIGLADLIQVPTYQKGTVDNRAICKVTKNKIDFDGAFRMTTTGRRVGEYQPPASPTLYQDTDGAATEYQDTDGAGTIWQDTDV